MDDIWFAVSVAAQPQSRKRQKGSTRKLIIEWIKRILCQPVLSQEFIYKKNAKDNIAIIIPACPGIPVSGGRSGKSYSFYKAFLALASEKHY
ncbi:MAG: hypothetical protein KQH63_12420 [Desulfobulbaceae bacterium]|nr:hypothetical protein [Desulfobulbaceae bacterium]